MRTAGLSVPEAVRDIVTRNRSIYDCIRMDVINYTALAVRIQPEIERQMGGPANLNTIVVAIKRYADSFEQKDADPEPALKNARLSLTDGMMDIRLSSDTASDPLDLLEKFSQITQDYDIIKLPGSFRLITEDLEGVRRLAESIPGGDRLLSTGLVRIRITVPGESRAALGSYVVELLRSRRIEFVDAYFGQDSMVVTFDGDDAARAYDVLRNAM